jgi:hypothetical protein
MNLTISLLFYVVLMLLLVEEVQSIVDKSTGFLLLGFTDFDGVLNTSGLNKCAMSTYLYTDNCYSEQKYTSSFLIYQSIPVFTSTGEVTVITDPPFIGSANINCRICKAGCNLLNNTIEQVTSHGINCDITTQMPNYVFNLSSVLEAFNNSLSLGIYRAYLHMNHPDKPINESDVVVTTLAQTLSEPVHRQWTFYQVRLCDDKVIKVHEERRFVSVFAGAYNGDMEAFTHFGDSKEKDVARIDKDDQNDDDAVSDHDHGMRGNANEKIVINLDLNHDWSAPVNISNQVRDDGERLDFLDQMTDEEREVYQNQTMRNSSPGNHANALFSFFMCSEWDSGAYQPAPTAMLKAKKHHRKGSQFADSG